MRDDVISSLVIALNDDNNDVSFHAAAALGEIGVASNVVIDGLCNLLSHEYSDVRGRAAQSLAKIYKRDVGNIDAVNKSRIQTILFQSIDKDDVRESSNFWQALWDVTSILL